MMMRIIETLFWALLGMILLRCGQGDNKKRDAVVAAIEKHMNEMVLGDRRSEHKGQWKFPLKDKEGGGKVLEPRNMTGSHAKKCMRAMKDIATVAFAKEFDQTTKTPRKTRQENANLEKQWHAIKSRSDS